MSNQLTRLIIIGAKIVFCVIVFTAAIFIKDYSFAAYAVLLLGAGCIAGSTIYSIQNDIE